MGMTPLSLQLELPPFSSHEHAHSYSSFPLLSSHFFNFFFHFFVLFLFFFILLFIYFFLFISYWSLLQLVFFLSFSSSFSSSATNYWFSATNFPSSSAIMALLPLVMTALHSSFGFFSILALKLLEGLSANCLANCST